MNLITAWLEDDDHLVYEAKLSPEFNFVLLGIPSTNVADWYLEIE